MCGFVGAVWDRHTEPLSLASLAQMTETLRQRGPDQDGYYLAEQSWGGVALGHRRLSVIDLDGGQQPLANEDRTVWVAYNGEIYNHAALRQQLMARGHQFRTRTDTEVLVHLYEDFGESLVEQLCGMFAFAIWDTRQRKLLLARDRMGQKPLVYLLEPHRLLFGSQIRALAAAPEVERSIDLAAVDAYLRLEYVPSPQTIYRGICKLPPAHLAVYREGRLTIRRYWQPNYEQVHRGSYAECRDQLRALVTEATRSQLVSDVPVGAFLSGGIDSTIISGVMRRLCDEVHTFSVGFDTPELDETEYAKQAAQHLGTRHRAYRVGPQSPDEVASILTQFDEPFADSSLLPTYYVSKFSRQHVTVALTGDGGDELFAGYGGYRVANLLRKFDRWPAWLRKLLTRRLGRALPDSATPESHFRRLKGLLRYLESDAVTRQMAMMAGAFNDAQRAALYHEDLSDQFQASDHATGIRESFALTSGRDSVSQSTFVHQMTYLPDDLLTKVDVTSMAHGLECRSPLLDHRVVEFAAGLPLEYKLNLREGKLILKDAFRELLPSHLRTRRKMGFTMPIDQWVRGRWQHFVREVLLDAETLARGYFLPRSIHELVDEHMSGTHQHGERLWTLLAFELWHRRHDLSLRPACQVGTSSFSELKLRNFASQP